MADIGAQRREFIRLGVKGLAAFAGGSLLSGGSLVLPSGRLVAQSALAQTEFAGLASLGPLLPPDANGIMLPAGYSSRVRRRRGPALQLARRARRRLFHS